MHKLCRLLAAMAAMAYSGGFAAVTVQDELNLTSDQTVNVAEGDTLIVKKLTGGAWTLTKTGAGTLQIADCDATEATVRAQEGRLEVAPVLPAACAKAYFHVDANRDDTLTTVQDDSGKTTVSAWTDVRGEGYPSAEGDGKKGKPFLSNDELSTRRLMDFGTFWASLSDTDGYGAYMNWSETIKNVVSVFAVMMDSEDTLYQTPSWGTTNGNRANVCVGLYQHDNAAKFAYRGNRVAVPVGGDVSQAQGAPIFNGGHSWQGRSTIYLDDDTSTTASSTPYPAGLHVLSVTVAAQDYDTVWANDFARERGNVLGGMRMGECLVFTNALEAAETAEIRSYLFDKWMKAPSFSVGTLQIDADAELAMPAGGRVTAKTYAHQGTFSGSGTVVADEEIGKTTTIDDLALSADTSYDVARGDTLVLKVVSGYNYLITKTGKGKLVIETVDNDKVRVDLREGILELNADGQKAAESALAKAWFHVDTTDAASMTTEESDGKTLVSAWADVRGAGHPSATATGGHLGHKPYVTENGCGGLPVMDFGSLYNRASDGGGTMRGLEGYGAAMIWSETCTNPAEVFAVIGDTEDAKDTLPPTTDAQWGAGGRPNSFFSYTDAVTGYRGDKPPMALLHSGSTLSANGVTCVVDGKAVTPSSYAVSDGMHVIDLKMTDATKSSPINAFARERVYAYGGVRIGEYIVFTEALTEDERAAVRAYLMRKWRPVTLARVTAAAGTEIRVPDGMQGRIEILEDKGATVTGTLVAGATFGDDIAVTDDATDDPIVDLPAWFHVDASADTLSISTTRLLEDNEVYCWSDVRGRKAQNGSDYPGDGGVYAWIGNSSYKPFLNASYLENGLPVVDFGPIQRPGLSNPQRYLLWKQGTASTEDAICERPYHFFVMVADHEDAKKGEGTSSQKRDQPFIGNTCSQTAYPTGEGLTVYPVLGRGDRPSDGTPGTYYLNGSGFASSFGRGEMRLDGQSVNPGDSFPEGFHLVSIDMNPKSVEGGRCRCNAFARERGNLYGGQRLGEVIVCNRQLKPEETARIDALLMAKWKDGVGVERRANAVSVAADKKLTLKYQRLAVANALTLDGTIAAKNVTAPATITVNSTNAAVEGALTVPATGTLVLGDGWKKVRGKQKVVAATSVSVNGGGTANWNVTLPEGSRCREAKVTVEADGVYVDFVPNGMMVIFR